MSLAQLSPSLFGGGGGGGGEQELVLENGPEKRFF